MHGSNRHLLIQTLFYSFALLTEIDDYSVTVRWKPERPLGSNSIEHKVMHVLPAETWPVTAGGPACPCALSPTFNDISLYI